MALNQVPLSGQTLNQSRPLIYANFITYIEPNFAVDHVGFNTGADSGKHKKVTLTQHSNALADQPVATSNGFVIYDAIPNVAADANFPVTIATSELNLIRQGTTKILPFTASAKTTVGWSYLPSGLLIKWGYVNGSGSRDTNQTYSYPTGAGIPVFSSVLTVNVGSTMNISGSAQSGTARLTFVQLVSTSATQIVVQSVGTFGASGNAHDFTYIAIGIGPV